MRSTFGALASARLTRKPRREFGAVSWLGDHPMSILQLFPLCTVTTAVHAFCGSRRDLVDHVAATNDPAIVYLLAQNFQPS